MKDTPGCPENKTGETEKAETKKNKLRREYYKSIKINHFSLFKMKFIDIIINRINHVHGLIFNRPKITCSQKFQTIKHRRRQIERKIIAFNVRHLRKIQNLRGRNIVNYRQIKEKVRIKKLGIICKVGGTHTKSINSIYNITWYIANDFNFFIMFNFVFHNQEKLSD